MSSVSVAAEVRAELGEAAIWDPAMRCVHWLDLPARRYFRLPDRAAAPASLALATGEQLACLARLPRGLLLVSASRAWSLSEDRLKPADLPLPPIDPARACFNDGKVDRHGYIWIGSSDLAEKDPLGRLWRISPDGHRQEVDSGFIVSNGPAFSPDGRTAYFADTFSNRILAYDLDRTGSPTGRRTLHADGPGYPDGLTVDAEGRIYSCRWGGGTVLVLDPNGTEIHRVDIPARNVTSATFGGEALDLLFVTTASIDCGLNSVSAEGMLFSVDGLAKGIAEPIFPHTLTG